MPLTTPIGMPQLMTTAFRGKSLQPIAEKLLQRIERDHEDAEAMIDLATIFEIHGHPQVALDFQTRALAIQQVYRMQQSENATSLRLLAILGPGLIMANMPVQFLIEPSSVQLDFLFVGEGIPVPTLPEHDVAIVAVCESEQNQGLLRSLEEVVHHWPRPILNAPGQIRSLARDTFGKLIENIAGVRAVVSSRCSQEQVQTESFVARLFPPHANEHWQWIIRPIDSHAGHGLQRINNPFELRRYLAEHRAPSYYVGRYIDYQSRDGRFRKYRIAMLQGECFPVHMAVSRHWMVHYLNADMLGNEENRAEEKQFMESFEEDFLFRHRLAFARLHRRLNLDYVVFDCAETTDGQLLVFEADNGAVVHSMDPPELFPYKIPAMARIFEAFEAMLARTVREHRKLAA